MAEMNDYLAGNGYSSVRGGIDVLEEGHPIVQRQCLGELLDFIVFRASYIGWWHVRDLIAVYAGYMTSSDDAALEIMETLVARLRLLMRMYTSSISFDCMKSLRPAVKKAIDADDVKLLWSLRKIPFVWCGTDHKMLLKVAIKHRNAELLAAMLDQMDPPFLFLCIAHAIHAKDPEVWRAVLRRISPYQRDQSKFVEILKANRDHLTSGLVEDAIAELAVEYDDDDKVKRSSLGYLNGVLAELSAKKKKPFSKKRM